MDPCEVVPITAIYKEDNYTYTIGDSELNLEIPVFSENSGLCGEFTVKTLISD